MQWYDSRADWTPMEAAAGASYGVLHQAGVAVAWLEAGQDTPALRELAAGPPVRSAMEDRDVVAQLWEDVLGGLGVPCAVDDEGAIVILARRVLRLWREGRIDLDQAIEEAVHLRYTDAPSTIADELRDMVDLHFERRAIFSGRGIGTWEHYYACARAILDDMAANLAGRPPARSAIREMLSPTYQW